MPRNSSGVYTLPDGYLATTGQTILASQHNPPLEDIASALTGSLPRNGTSGMLAALPMGGFKVTNVADGSANSDAATVGQVNGLISTSITGAATKTTPIDADSLTLIDSAAGNAIKRVTWANVKAFFQPASSVLSALASTGTAVVGDIIYGNGSGTWGRLAKGTAGQFLQMNSGATAPQWSSLLFTQSFESSPQTITAGGSLTLAHGLGTQPKFYLVFLKCAAGELGYSAGDEVLMDQGGGTGGKGISIVPDATNINVRFSNTALDIINKSNGSGSTMNSSNWRIIVRSWA